MLLLLIQVIVTFLIGVLIVLYLNQLQRSKRLQLPSPTLVPVLGHVLEFGSTAVEIHKNIIRIVNTYGKMLQVWFGPFTHLCIISDTEVSNKLLSSPNLIQKSTIYDFLAPWLGNGLLLSKGEKWYNRRKMLTPAFHFTILEQSVTKFRTVSNVFIKNLEKHLDGEVFDIYPYVTLLGLDVICKTAMGIDMNAQTEYDSEYVTAVRHACRIVFERVFSVVQQSDFIFYNFTKNGKQFKKCINILHSFTNKVIEERRQLILEPSNGNEVETSSPNANTDDSDVLFGDKKERMVFIDLLLRSSIDGEPLTNSDIQNEVHTFIFEGHDTVSSGVSFTLYLLSNHPEIQKRVFEEAKEIYGDDLTKEITLADLTKMKYLEAVIKESMRLYPPIPIIGRMLNEDLHLDNGCIPKDTQAMIMIYCIHHNAEYFPDPETFKPERFLTETENKNYFSYVPFSAGSRNCIGKKFAMHEMKSTISKVLRHFELCPAGPEYDLKLAMAIVLKSVNGINIKIKPRSYN